MRLYKLLDAIHETYDKYIVHPENDNEDLRPRNGLTYCNKAVWIVASKLGYFAFYDKTANQIIDIMESSSEWANIALKSVQETVYRGHLVIAGEKGIVNGHVVVVVPGSDVASGKWGIRCPRCMNIGESVFISKGINWAFKKIPEFWVLA